MNIHPLMTDLIQQRSNQLGQNIFTDNFIVFATGMHAI